MTFEALYPDLCSLYGEAANLRYLARCCPEARVISTTGQSAPAFLREPVDLVYLGAMSERCQELALERLMPHRAAIREKIEAGLTVLATGNALELFGREIWEGERRIPALDIFPYSARRDMRHRHNSMFLGRFRDMDVVGYKSQFSKAEIFQPFLTVTGGFGTDLQGKEEGVHYKNFYGTYLLGPFLVLNPPFTRYLLESLGWHGSLAFEREAREAYQYRLAGLQTPGVNFLVGEHG